MEDANRAFLNYEASLASCARKRHNSAKLIFNDVEELWQDRSDWTLTALNVAVPKARRFAAGAEESDRLYTLGKADVVARIKELQLEEDTLSGTAAQEALGLAARGERIWRDRRQATPGKRAGSNLQSFLVTFNSFLESFAGIAELLKGADQQYGGLAYGTIS
ncbi:hypothetical protein LTR53_006972, partial [Teratosphaeriaceae sp. CCFEE 6253]